MQLVVISHHEVFAENLELEAQTINSLFDNGLEKLHVRKPDLSETEVRSLIESINSDYYDRLNIHSHHNLVEEYNLGGMHYQNSEFKRLVEKDPKVFESRSLNKSLSTSFHNISDLHRFKDSIDYCFLSPIFDSISDPRKKSSFSTKELLTSKPQLRKTFALGGIDTSNLSQVRDLGFKGAALKGYIWQSDSPIESFLEIKKLCH